MTLGVLILTLVTLQRVGELWLSNRNTKRLLKRGAHEVAPSHYPLIVAVHVLWLASLWWLAPGQPVNFFWLGAYVLLQVARIWVIRTLGERWTTRIIILPGAPLVTGGPYRVMRHPNYLAVMGELAGFALMAHAVLTGPASVLMFAWLITRRIRVEERALHVRSD